MSDFIGINDDMPTNVIVLKEAVKQYISNRCKHKTIIVDPEHATVECGQCGEKLDPIGVLYRFVKEETSFGYKAMQINQAMALNKQLQQELANKQRCKCQHCNRITKIDRRVGDIGIV